MPRMTIRAKRLSNAIIRGLITPAEFDLLINAAGRLDEFSDLMDIRGQADLIAASTTATDAVIASPNALAAMVGSAAAMAAVADSATAMAAVADSATAVAAVVGSATAMAAVAASASAMTAVASSTTFKIGVYESDVALSAIFNSSTAMTTLRAAATIYNKAANGTTSVSLEDGVTPANLISSGKYICLGVSHELASQRTITITTRRTGSSRPASAATNEFSFGANANRLMCCPVTGPLSFKINTTGTNKTYFSMLRCDA